MTFTHSCPQNNVSNQDITRISKNVQFQKKKKKKKPENADDWGTKPLRPLNPALHSNSQ